MSVVLWGIYLGMVFLTARADLIAPPLSLYAAIDTACIVGGVVGMWSGSIADRTRAKWSA